MDLRFVGIAMAALLIAAPAAHADLITNGGFETGDFTDWTLTNDGGNSFVYGSDALYGPHSGSYEALLGAYGSDGTLSQSITDIAGSKLVLTYWLATDSSAPNDFSAYWDGKQIAGSALTNIAYSGYTEYTFEVSATGSDVLAFNERDDFGFLSLDDVSLNMIPEPGTLALFSVGLVGLGAIRWRRKATKAT